MTDHALTDIALSSLGLHPALMAGLDLAGFSRCTPIQALTLPEALKGRDVAGQAQTGTGKTAAFLLATMHRLLSRPAAVDRRDNDPRAVILAPTRELAIQIDKDARVLNCGAGFRIALVYGGIDYDKQRQQLKDGVDIIIATPGRLIDYFKQDVFSFRAVEVVVIDEADRMFDLGFIKDIRYLLRRMPPREQRQGMLFSATLSYRVLELAYEHMNEPVRLEVEAGSVTAARVRQCVYFPATEEKLALLVNLLRRAEPGRTMVFVNTRHVGETVYRKLRHYGFRAGLLSGDVPQKKRQSLLQRFHDGDIDLLVATDVAARGLHVPEVSHVFNYDLPQDVEDYVHRVGRTARLGASGDAISFACEKYAMTLPDIEAYIGQKLPVLPLDPQLLEAPLAAPLGEDADAVSAEDRPQAHKPAGSRSRRRRRRATRSAPAMPAN